MPKGAQRSSVPSDAEPRTLGYLLVRENEWGRIYPVGYSRVLGTVVDFVSRYDVILTALNQSLRSFRISLTKPSLLAFLPRAIAP